jgi:hypothetical protein
MSQYGRIVGGLCTDLYDGAKFASGFGGRPFW